MSPAVTDPAAVTGRPVPGRVLVALLAPTLLVALGILAFFACASVRSQAGSDSFDTGLVGFVVVTAVWNLLPFAAMAALTAAAVRFMPRGLLALGIGALVLAAGTAALLGEMLVDESSTAGLLLLFLPFYQGVLVAVTAVATVGLHWARTRRPPRS